MKDRPTYPELLKLFYKHSFPDKLGAPGSAVAQAIIYKSNELWFPAEFAMSNRELAQLSGEKQANIGRTRQKVLDTCIVDGKPMFMYVSNGKHKAGKYILNFNLCSGLTSTYRQKQGKIDNDLNSTKQNETNPPTPLNKVTIQEGDKTKTEDGGNGVFAIEEKTEKEFEAIRFELERVGVKEPSRSRMAKEYNTRYLERQILQLKKDDEKGIKFRNFGGALVARIKSNYTTEDYPE